MKKLRGIGTAGLSLVELIISMAILAVVGVAIGGAMYVSSNSYTRGSSEINVQEEAQIASNLICDWIVDATAVNPDGSGGFIDGDSTSLVIVHPDGDNIVEITVAQSGSELTYVAKDVTDPSDIANYGREIASGVLAKNLSGCFFTSTFGTDRNVKISLDFNVNQRTYRAVTDSTSRSHDFISTGGTSTLAGPTIRFALVSNDGGAHVVLEPGQNSAISKYTFFVYVDGCDVDSLISPGLTYTAPASANSTIESCTRQGTTNCWKVVVKADDSASHDDVYTFNVRNAVGADTKDLTVKIRKVTKCAFTVYNLEDSTNVNSDHVWAPTTGNTGKSGSVYNNSIDLGIQNFDNESSQIVDTDSSIPGGLGYDSSPWNYVDPSQIKVFFKQKSGSNWVDAPSGTGTYTVTYGTASPSLQVRLNSDISSDLYVIVVAPHSGTINGNPSNSSDPFKGVSSGNPIGKVWNLDHRVINYGDGGHAFYDVIKIKKGGSTIYTNVGGGIRRGTPACMICNFAPNAQSTVLGDIRALKGITDDNTIKNDDGAHIKYTTILYYTPINPATGVPIGPEEHFVVANITNWGNLWSDYIARRIYNNTSSLFKLDTAYSVNFQLNVYYDGSLIKTYPHSGSICAAEPYVYDAADNKFHDNKFTETNPKVLTGNDEEEFGVFIDGCVVKTHRIEFKAQYWDPVQNKWIDDTTVINTADAWFEGSHTFNGDNVSQVVLDDGRTYTIGNYDENEPNVNNLRTSIESFKIKKDKIVPGRLYRVVFDTHWDEAQSVYRGEIGGAASDSTRVSVSNITPQSYTLGGEWYFRK